MTDSATSDLTSMTEPVGAHAVLVPGYWLGGWAWRHVEPGLRAGGVSPHPVTLPGLDGSRTEGLTLDDHIDAVLGLVDRLAGDIVLVGHSGGGAVVQGVIDRCPQRVSRVIYLDTGPLRDGTCLWPGATDDLPLPSWDELAADHLSIEGMDDGALAMLRERAVKHPGGVVGSPIRLRNDARLGVPVTVVCTSLPSAVLRQMIDAGQVPSELPSVRDLRYIDMPTGHWPMFSRPADLADLLCSEILDP